MHVGLSLDKSVEVQKCSIGDFIPCITVNEMDKLISFFQPEKRRAAKIEEDIGERDVPVVEDRRKWSISRSGRMKQANKKRHSVAKDLYGDTCAPVERPKSLEYHVNVPAKPLETVSTKSDAQRSPSDSAPKSPEEEIESAFEILDKVVKIEKLEAS